MSCEFITYVHKFLCRHFQLDKRTIAKYTCGLPVQEIQFPAARIKSPSNSWEKRPGGIQLITQLKTYWKDHLITSPKKNDLVFKHVRGHGKHMLVEINGLKEMLCAPGLTWSFEQNFTAQTQTINFYKSAEQLNVTRVWMWIPPARFPHSSSSCPLWDVYSRLSSAQRSCYRVPFQKHSTLLRIKTQPNVSSFFHKTSFKRFFLIYRIF